MAVAAVTVAAAATAEPDTAAEKEHIRLFRNLILFRKHMTLFRKILI